MGKTQSKSLGLYRKRDGPEGECFVVNAHFNPLAVADLEDTYVVKPPKSTTSEITFSVSNCTNKDEEVGRRRAGFADDKYPLKVVLPPESCDNSDTSCIKEDLSGSKSSEASDEKKDIAFQSFECDVSVEADVKGNEKQEFLFTLYDLDGYGKITKDDLASLVRGIYEAMGSSLKLSPSGSKTIRVRLTIAPDRKLSDEVKLKMKKTKKKKGRKRPEGSENEVKPAMDDDKEQQQQDGQHQPRDGEVVVDDEEKRTIPGVESEEDEDREGDDEEEDEDGEEGGEDDEDKELYSAPVTECPKTEVMLSNGSRRSHHNHHHHQQHQQQQQHHHHHHHQQQRQESRHSNPLSVRQPVLDSQHSHRSPSWLTDDKIQKSPQFGTSPLLGRKRNRVSFSSPSKLLQKNQLLEIIQANLEKNSFGNYVENSKNRYGDGTTGCEERLKRHHHRSWVHGGKWNLREGQSHYLDLAGIENYASVSNRHVEEADVCPAADVQGEGVCPYHVVTDANHQHHQHHHHHPPPPPPPKQSWECGHHACHHTANRSRNHHHQRHHRSRSHDLADPTCSYFRYRLLGDGGGGETVPQSSTRMRTEDEEEEGLLSSCKFPGGGGDKSGEWQNGRHHHHHHHSHGGGVGHHRRERDLHAALYHARSKSYDAYYCEQVTQASLSPKLKEHTPKRGGGAGVATGSPHHHKHRHREREHQRAMQQVASWIEKEHMGFGGCNLLSKTEQTVPVGGGHVPSQQQPNNHHYCSQQHHIPTAAAPPPPPPPPPPPQPPHVIHNQRPSSPRTDKTSFLVERHEHHHVHEHFHHHYHHYHDL